MHRLVRGHALRRGADEASRADRVRCCVAWCLAADVAATGRKRLRVADRGRFLGDESPAMSGKTALACSDP